MKTGIPYVTPRSLFAALLAASALFTQLLSAQSVVTDPVGFMNFTPAPSANGTTRKFTVASFPLQGASAWTGSVASTPGATTLSGSSAAWTANQYAASGGFATYVARVKSGNGVGRIFPIVSNTTTTLTVQLPSTVTNLATTVSTGDSFEILPVNTLGSLFGSTAGTVQFKQNTLENLADLVYLWNGSAWVGYWYDPTLPGWVSEGDQFTDYSTTPVYSTQAIWVARISTASTTISYSINGTVPTTSSLALAVPGTSTSTRVFTFVSNPFPADVTLDSLNFRSLPSWASNSLENSADVVYLWNGSAWVGYWYDPTLPGWVSEGDQFTDYSTTAIPAGTGVWVARKSSSSTSESALVSITKPYN